MRPQKVLDIEILTALSTVFRSKGYEGASLKDLSEATGLKKASLYHRFPNGKQEMADAVLHYIGTWVRENVFKALLDTTQTPKKRLKNALLKIRTLYDDGNNVCIFRALSMQSGLELFEDQIKNSMKDWITAFKKIGIALELSPKQAEKIAMLSLVQIQGSLVVAKGLGDIGVFESTIRNIEHSYLEA